MDSKLIIIKMNRLRKKHIENLKPVIQKDTIIYNYYLLKHYYTYFAKTILSFKHNLYRRGHCSISHLLPTNCIQFASDITKRSEIILETSRPIVFYISHIINQNYQWLLEPHFEHRVLSIKNHDKNTSYLAPYYTGSSGQ